MKKLILFFLLLTSPAIGQVLRADNPVLDTLDYSLRIPSPLTNTYLLGTDATDLVWYSPSTVKTNLSLNNVENTALSTWGGSTNLITLGTITTGTWNGTAIANANLANSSMAIAGNSIALGGAISLDQITGVVSNGYLKRTGSSTLSNVTVITVPDGGTGLATLTAHALQIGNGTGTITQAGTGTTGQILESNGSGTDPAFASAPIGVYGDGSDASLNYDGTTTVLGVAPSSSKYTLARDIYASSIMVHSGVTIIEGGFRIYCTGTLTDSGTVQNNGSNATNSNAGGTAFGGSLGTCGAGGAGGTSGNGSNGTTITNAGGGAGGTGGISGQGQSGGTAGAVGAINVFNGGIHNFIAANTGSTIGNGSDVKITGGAGGSGGGGSGTNNGGGGGGGGGVLLINAYKIINPGTISANGGNGGAGTGANGGGGGGGGGGCVLLMYHSYSGNAATATRGAGNTTVTGTGHVGTDGNDGNVVTIQN